MQVKCENCMIGLTVMADITVIIVTYGVDVLLDYTLYMNLLLKYLIGERGSGVVGSTCKIYVKFKAKKKKKMFINEQTSVFEIAVRFDFTPKLINKTFATVG